MGVFYVHAALAYLKIINIFTYEVVPVLSLVVSPALYLSITNIFCYYLRGK